MQVAILWADLFIVAKSSRDTFRVRRKHFFDYNRFADWRIDFHRASFHLGVSRCGDGASQRSCKQ